MIIGHLKNNKSPDENEVSPKLLKYGGGQLAGDKYDIIKVIWQQKKIPVRWKDNAPTHKGNKLNCNNYRRIALMDTAYKIFGTLIRNRLQMYAENEMGEYQCGFRKKRSVTDQFFILKGILTCYKHYSGLHVAFVDFRRVS